MKYLVFDYETRSEANLKRCGAYNYARHPSTEIVWAAWQLVELQPGHAPRISPVRKWSPILECGNAKEFIYYICDPSVALVAHNAFFEQVITRFVLPKYFPLAPQLRRLPHERFICTASLAAALALPRSLDGACSALGLPIQKDAEGKRLVHRYCKPRRVTKHNPGKYHQDLDGLLRFGEYCATDVEATTGLFLAVPPLTGTERKVWLLDQKMNMRGFHVDRELIASALKLSAEELQRLNKRLAKKTGGAVTAVAQRARLLSWCQKNGAPKLKALGAEPVRDALAAPWLREPARGVLRLRQAAAKTSTAKYAAFTARTGVGDRVRDILMYHGASTGRATGTGVQPHNFPRGTIKNSGQAAHFVKTGDLEMLRLLYGNPLETLASCLRSVIDATPGKELFCEDYSAIEARVLLWLAGDKAGLAVFRRGEDPYRLMASRIYKIVIEAVTKAQRELGKRAELGCGYGMGWEKFQETCKTHANLTISDDLAKLAVKIFREVHPEVVQTWANYERAAIKATREPGTIVSTNKTKWFVKNKFLFCELPSGRRLAYYGPVLKLTYLYECRVCKRKKGSRVPIFDCVKFEKCGHGTMKRAEWAEPKSTLYHYGVHPKTRKWVLDMTYGGRLTENITQAVARDFMVEATLRAEAQGYDVLLTVHDEVLSEREKGGGSYAEYQGLLRKLPAWGKGCPIKTEGWGPENRYRK